MNAKHNTGLLVQIYAYSIKCSLGSYRLSGSVMLASHCEALGPILSAFT